VARSEKEQRSTSHALEAFHRTFNFCLNCRQYTCGDCWNAVEGRCLTCAPTPDAVPPETRQDTLIRVTPVDLAQPPVPIRVDPRAADVLAPADVPTDGIPTKGFPVDGMPTDGRPADTLPPELEPIDLAVARAEAKAQAEEAVRAEAEAARAEEAA